MLTGLFFMTLFASPDSYANEKAPFASDSAIIERHVWDILIENTVEEFSEHSFNSHLSRAELDSILWEEQRMKIGESAVTWSPDSLFRICTVELIICGAYCNSEWYSWLHFNDGSGLVIKDIPFDVIVDIDIMKDGKYLVTETSWGRSGVYSCSGIGSHLFSFSDHQIRYHRIPDPMPTDVPNDLSIGVYSCTYMSDEAVLSYNAANNELTFHRCSDPGPFSEPDSISLYDGVLQYADTGFVVKKYSETRIKYVAPE